MITSVHVITTFVEVECFDLGGKPPLESLLKETPSGHLPASKVSLTHRHTNLHRRRTHDGTDTLRVHPSQSRVSGAVGPLGSLPPARCNQPPISGPEP